MATEKLNLNPFQDVLARQEEVYARHEKTLKKCKDIGAKSNNIKIFRPN